MVVVKKMIRRITKSTVLGECPTFSYAELQVALSEAENVINDSPLHPQSLTEEDLIPVTINHLLLGSTSTQAITYNPKGKLVCLDRLEQNVRSVVCNWWKQ